MSELLHARIAAAVDQVALVDTHEHLLAEAERHRAAVDFGYLFPHYASSDLVSSGMPPAVLEDVRASARPVLLERMARIGWIRKPAPPAGPSRPDLSLDERWAALAPYWERIRHTGYGTCLRIAMRDLFGQPDLTGETYAPLSEAIAASRRPGWYRHVLRERARIAVSIQDDYRTDVDRELFAPVVRLEQFACPTSRQDLRNLEADTGRSLHSLDDLVAALHASLERDLSRGAVGVKIGVAYRRSLRFEKVARPEAERVFARLFGHLGEGPSWAEARPLQDYMFHEIVRAAMERDVPLQIHTGLQEGNENLLANSDPLLLANLCIEYRRAKFDLFHGAYPFTGPALALAKNFPNVFLDLCWLPIISPSAAARVLHEAIETVPANKILAFGGDFIIPEGAYGHSVMARRIVSRVLGEKVEEGYLDEAAAVRLAQRVLRDNAASLYNLKDLNR
ncbi:MAG: amidohydrolase family protein [Candidatus Methylomirabilales bacterium]